MSEVSAPTTKELHHVVHCDFFRRHYFSARAQIYAARDEAIRAIIEREKTQGRDESHPDVQAQIGEAQQYTEELISKLRDAE